MNVDEKLRELGAHELIGGFVAWNRHALCPYSESELRAFANIDSTQNDALRTSFDEFKRKLSALPESERIALRTWAHAQFVESEWSVRGRLHARPEFAHSSFFNVHKKSGKMLDVAPAHGVHGLLLFRDHYRLPLEYHAADMLPAYNKLLSILGVEVTHYNASFDSLAGGPYDIVTCTEFLEHVDQATEDRILDSIANVTIQGSTLLITFPVDALPHGLLDDPMGHVRQPKTADIIARMKDFRVMNHGTFRGSKVDQNFLIGVRE